MESQEQSQFLSLPHEILHAIYVCLIPNAIHIFLRQGKIAISTCIEPKTAGDLTGVERKPSGDSSDETIWARRLESSWGPHWQCEEAAKRTARYQSHQASCDFDQGETTMALLFVCKRMHTHILGLMASTAIFHVTDLETLDHLAQSHLNFKLSPSPYGLHAVGPLLRKLSISLRLPLSLFEAVSSGATTSSPSANTQMPDVSVARHTTNIRACDQSNVWRRVWPALAMQLKRLQSLHLWLDHDSKPSWSFVDERAALSSIIASLSPDKIHCLKDVSVGLPNLHPRYEKPERHFTKKSLQPPAHVAINRRLRQRNFYEEDSLGQISVTYAPDFPIALEILEYEFPAGQNPTREELEYWERETWERGQDMNDVLTYLFGPACSFVGLF